MTPPHPLPTRELEHNQEAAGLYPAASWRLTPHPADPHNRTHAAAQIASCPICATYANHVSLYADTSLKDVQWWLHCRACGHNWRP